MHEQAMKASRMARKPTSKSEPLQQKGVQKERAVWLENRTSKSEPWDATNYYL
jgi:hypothetical protein